MAATGAVTFVGVSAGFGIATTAVTGCVIAAIPALAVVGLLIRREDKTQERMERKKCNLSFVADLDALEKNAEDLRSGLLQSHVEELAQSPLRDKLNNYSQINEAFRVAALKDFEGKHQAKIPVTPAPATRKELKF